MAKDKVRSILVTGFDPFGGMDVNSSWLAVKALPDEIAGRQIIKLELPTVFGKAGEALYAAVKAHQPEAVICVGQSGESAKVRLERLAINLIDARIPDNEGNQPVDVPVREDAPDAYFTRLPVTKLLQALEDNDISAEIGAREADQDIDIFVSCSESGNWYGYGGEKNEVMSIDLPQWVLKQQAI